MENKISKTDRGFADYELENITKLLKKCKKKGVKGRILTPTQTIQFIDKTDNNQPFKSKLGGYVSILPISNEMSFLDSDGLKYSLKGVTVSQGETLTLSNEAKFFSFSLEIKSGEGLLIIER